MAEGGTVVVELEPRLDQRKAKGQFGALAGVASKAFIAAFAAKQVFDIGAGLVNAAEEYESLVAGAGNLVEQQQKSLGEEATLTTEGLIAQADALQKLTGFSNEQILAGERQLLSFQNIQNAGEGTEAIYDRTTRALTDLVASGAISDFNSGAIQLGKALNDPTKGIAALGRAGIQFTESQKDQIKGLQESGDLLGAQKIILDELETVYGGTAEAQRDSTDVISNAFQDLQVKAGKVLLPVIERLATWIVDVLIPAFERLAPHVGEAARILGDAWKKTWEILQPIWQAIQGAIARVRSIFERDGDKMAAKSEEVFERLKPVWDKIVEVITKAAELIGHVISFYVDLYTAIWNEWGDVILEALGIAWNQIAGVVEGALDIITGILDVFIGIFTGDWEMVWGGLEGIVQGAWDILVSVVEGSIETLGLIITGIGPKILEWLGNLWDIMYGIGEDMMQGMKDGVVSMASALGNAVKDTVLAPVNWVKDKLGISSPSKVFMEFGEAIPEGMAIGIADGAKKVQRATDAMIPGFQNRAGMATGGAAAGMGGTHIEINNPVQRTTNSGIQKGLALGRLMGA